MSNKIDLPQVDDQNLNEQKNNENIVFEENSNIQNNNTKLNTKISNNNAKEKKFISFKKINKQEKTEDIIKTKKFAWLAYILFFIPLLIDRNSEFVKHNANEGLEIFFVDILGIVFLLIGVLVKSTATVTQMFMIIFTIVGVILLVLTTITKIYMIIASLLGKVVTTPWLAKIKIIK